MPDWIHNKDANFVIAAYVLAFVALGGIFVSSLCAYKSRAKEWQALQKQDK